MIWVLINSSPKFPETGVAPPENGQFSSLSLPCGKQDSRRVWNQALEEFVKKSPSSPLSLEASLER